MVATPPKNVIESQPIIDPSKAHTDILSEEQRTKTKQLQAEKEERAALEKERIQQQALETAKKEQAEKDKIEKEAQQRKEAEQATDAQKIKESDRRFEGRSIKAPLEIPVAHGALPSQAETNTRIDENLAAKRQAALEKLKSDRAKEKERGNER